jgi:hypothetical protein
MLSPDRTAVRGADLAPGDHVRLVSPLWRGVLGVVSYVGAYVVEIELDDGAIVSFLPIEVEPRDQIKPAEARYGLL